MINILTLNHMYSIQNSFTDRSELTLLAQEEQIIWSSLVKKLDSLPTFALQMEHARQRVW